MSETSLFYNYYLNFIKRSGYEVTLKNLRYSDRLDSLWEKKYLALLINKLNEIGKFALLDFYKIHNEKGKMSYETYISKFNCNDFINEFENTYPVLKDILSQKLEQEIKNLLIVIENVSNNFSKIMEAFNIKASKKITDINTFMGDSHKGKVVAKIAFDDGYCLMYKSRENVGERIVGALSEIFDIEFAIPKTLKLKDFYIQEYVTQDFFETEEQIKNYYYRFGMMTTIFISLGTTDLHSENVIATLHGPKFIDLETIITISPNEGYFNGSAIKNTMLYPRSTEKKVYTGMDLSAFSGGVSSADIEVFDVLFEKDELVHGKKKVRLPETQNIPRINSKIKINPYDYTKYVLAGYDEGCKRILSVKDKFINIISNNLKGTIRTVVRNTAFYSTFLYSSYLPIYLKSYEKRNQLFELLSTHSKMNKEIIKVEQQDLSNSMIPLFEYDLSKDESLKASKEMYFERLKNINDNFFEQERNVLMMILSLNNIAKNEELKNKNISLENKARINYELEKYISYCQKGNLFSYVTIDKALSDNLIETNNDIFVFGGSLLMLALMDKSQNQFIYKDKIINTINYDIKKKNYISGLNGAHSENLLIFLLYLIYSDKKFLEILDNRRNDIQKLNLDELDVWDFSTVGSALIVDNIMNGYFNSKKMNLLDNQTITLYKSNCLERIGNSGLFHGYSGDLLLFSTLSKTEGIEKYENEILTILEQENNYYLDSIENWNDTRSENIHDMVAISYGAPGILISRLFLLGSIDKSLNNKLKTIAIRDIKRSVNKIIKTPRMVYYDDTFINGYSGGLFALVLAKHMAFNIFSQEEIEKVSNYIEKGKQQLNQRIWRCQGMKNVYLPNFMNGSMGIVFVLFFIDNYDAIKGWVRYEED